MGDDGVVGIVLFCCFYMRRSFETKEVEFLLSRPLSRMTFLFSHAAAYIVLSLAVAAVVTLAVFTSLGTWNDFMWPLIVLNDSELYTLPVALASLSREHVQDNELMMAGAVLTTLPVICVFLALQRYYIDGLMLGSVKG